MGQGWAGVNKEADKRLSLKKMKKDLEWEKNEGEKEMRREERRKRGNAVEVWSLRVGRNGRGVF